MTEQSPRVLVARCDNYREDVDQACHGEIRFRWGMSQSGPCDVCGSRCGVAVAAWERVEPADPSPASPGALAIVRDLVTTLDEFVEEHSDPGTRALGVLSEARRFISTGGTGHVEDSPEVDAIAETINAVVGMSVPFPKLMAAARGVEKLIEARRAGTVPDTGQAREPGYERIAQAIEDVCDAAEMDIDAYRNSVGIEKPYLALARALDKAGLIDWAAFDEPSGDTVQAPESPTDSTPKAGRWGSGEAETATGTVQAPDAGALALADRLTRRAEVIRPREDRDDLDQGNVDDIHEHGYHTGVADALKQVADEIRRLLGTDTTPDRLAWISEAGETAAAERQARYQETACARRYHTDTTPEPRQ
jgi:hypothetical protein